MQPKFVAAQKMLLKTENPANICKWIARFYYFRHLYSAGSACIASLLYELLIDITHLHRSLIYFWVPSSCFCIVISLSLRVNNPVQRCLPVGEGCIIHAEAVVASRTDWQTASLMCKLTTTSGNITSRRASFSALASSTPSCILHRAQQHHADASVCWALPRSPASVLWHFCRVSFVGNGVITVMINSPWQADEDAG